MSTHRSVWQATTSQTTYPKLEQDLHVDVAIVGAGITGLTAATLLKRGGKRVALLEAHHIGAGTTGNTSGHLTTLPDRKYSTLLQTFGEDGAREVRRSMEEALDLVERLSESEADFTRLPGYLYTESAGNVYEVEQEYRAAQRVGLAVGTVEALPLPFRVEAAFRVEHQARFKPLRYLQGLAEGVQGGGGGSYVFEGSRVTNFSEGEPCLVETAGGTVRAKDVILATHTPLGVNVLHTVVAPYRSYVLGVKVAGETPQGLFWDTADPYHYTRPFYHDGEELLLIGGADHKTGEAEEPRHFDRLEAYVRERLPGAEIRYRWSSQYYEPSDGLPLIGLSPFAEHIHVGTGYSGDGLTFGSLAGLMLSRDLLGEPNFWRDLYSTRRLKLGASAREWLTENLDVAKRLVLDRFGGDGDFAEVAPGEGKVLSHRGEKLAVYRDDMGAPHVRSAVCPHLGCIVHWNSSERSWDCPCHGSRFGTQGEPLIGPALEGLKGG